MKPTAYVINLDRRPDRWQRTQDLWSPFFDLVRVSAIDMPTDGAWGCKLSHLECAQKYLADNASILVLEDDAEPTPSMDAIGLDYIAEAQAHLYEWDFVMGGAFLDLSPIGLPRAQLTATDSPLFWHSTYGHNTHWMLYNHRSIPLLQASLNSPLPIDMWIGRNAKDLWVPVSLLATQSDSVSDIRPAFGIERDLYKASDIMLNSASDL